jgi:hypothetical protein
VNINGEGFWLQHEAAGTCLIIPPGYMVVVTGNYDKDTAGEDGSHGVRWGLLDAVSSSELSTCEKLVENIIETYPACKEGDYPAWLQCIRRHLLPAAAAHAASM